jgi:twitching motility two-component system response regulator PilH
VRRNRKLRRKKRIQRRFPAGDGPTRATKAPVFNKIGKPSTTPKKNPKVAADVQFSNVENCAERMRVQKKVLIVDDSPAQVKLIQGLLEPEGYWPVGLNDPRRVEEAIAMERPSVILLDVVMPERNGFQVCRELKGNTEFNSIPVILVTSKDTASDRYWGQQQGADGYVTKPFTREELLRAVRRFA